MTARRRTRRAPSADSQGMTQADLDAIRNYRTNRTSLRYYGDLKAIDNPAPAAPTQKDPK